MCLEVASAAVTFMANCKQVTIWRGFSVRVQVALLNQRLLLGVPLPLPLSKLADLALGSSASTAMTLNQLSLPSTVAVSSSVTSLGGGVGGWPRGKGVGW